MTTWPKDQLKKIADGDDLYIAPLRDDGVTYGTPTWIRSVEVDGELFVRAYNGKSSRWYQAALHQQAGRVTAAGSTLDVDFEPATSSLNDKIDAAYRAKYRESPYLESMISAPARATTIQVVPYQTKK